MAGTVTTNTQFFTGSGIGAITDCDNLSIWTGTPTQDPDFYVQGTGSLSKKVSNTTATFTFSLISPVDLSDTIIYMWFAGLKPPQFDTAANGGIRIRVGSGSTWGEWYVEGSDTYKGGWQSTSVRTTRPFSGSSGTPSLVGIDKIGVTFKTVASSTKINCWWDAIRYGTYLGIISGSASSPGTFQDFVSYENTNKIGIIEEKEGVLFAQGKLLFGSTTSGTSTYFSGSNTVLVFKDRPFGDFYDIKIQGNADATTSVYFGGKAGGRGISGCVFRSAGASKYTFTATDTNITNLGVYGCSFFDASTISLPPYSVNREFTSCTVEQSAELLADTSTVQYCNFVTSDPNPIRAIRMSSTTHDITDTNFISCPIAVHINANGTYTFDNLRFIGNTYDIEKSTNGGTIYIDRVNGSNPSPDKILYTGTPTGSVVINPLSVTLKVTVKDEAAQAISGSSVAIYKTADWTELMNTTTGNDGIASTTYQYIADTPITVRIRRSTPGFTRYIPIETSGLIESTGYSLLATMYVDTNIT